MTMQLDGTRGITNATWTTATRPENPVIGQMGYNSVLGVVETWNGTAWMSGGANNRGTVTQVQGNGVVSGLSLSGNVTTIGNITLVGPLNLSAPPVIGTVTPNVGIFTNLTAANASIGNIFVTKWGDGANTYGNAGQILTSTGNSAIWANSPYVVIDLASPPPIGDITPNTGFFTNLTITSNLIDSSGSTGTSSQILAATGAGVSWVSSLLDLSSPPPIGDITPNTGNFTVLTVPNTLVISQGLANISGSLGDANQLLTATGNGIRWANSTLTANLAAPPPIGNRAPNQGYFTDMSVVGNIFDAGRSAGRNNEVLITTGFSVKWDEPLSGVGYNDSWWRFGYPDRQKNITYLNDTGAPMLIAIVAYADPPPDAPGQNATVAIFIINPETGVAQRFRNASQTIRGTVFAFNQTVIPAGYYYRVFWNANTILKQWAETRSGFAYNRPVWVNEYFIPNSAPLTICQIESKIAVSGFSPSTTVSQVFLLNVDKDTAQVTQTGSVTAFRQRSINSSYDKTFGVLTFDSGRSIGKVTSTGSMATATYPGGSLGMNGGSEFHPIYPTIWTAMSYSFPKHQVWGCKSTLSFQDNSYSEPFYENQIGFAYAFGDGSYWSTGVSGTVYRYTGGSAGITTEVFPGPNGQGIFSPTDGNAVYVTNKAARQVHMISIKDGYLGYLDLNDWPPFITEPYGMCFSSDGEFAYVMSTFSGGNQLVIYQFLRDLETGLLTYYANSVPYPGGIGSVNPFYFSQIAPCGDGQFIAVANLNRQSVSIWRPASW